VGAVSLSNREQLWAFLALITAILILGLAPIVTSGLMGKTMSDALIAVSDKTVTGLVGVLGTIAAMIFRTNRADEARAENTGRAFDAITAAANATPTPQPVTVTNSDTNPVPVVPPEPDFAHVAEDPKP
jgi:hypothetical protein